MDLNRNCADGGGAASGQCDVPIKNNDPVASAKSMPSQTPRSDFSAGSAATCLLLVELLTSIAPTLSALAAFADRVGVTRRQACRARAGKPLCAGAHLALCGALGIDPMDGTRRDPKPVSPYVEWWLLAAALYFTRELRRLDQRRAAKAIGTSPSTVCRLEAAKPISIANLIKVCRFIGVHADGYTAPKIAAHCRSVCRETTTETLCPVIGISARGSADGGAK
jgi:Helix-turn-helix